MESIWSLGTGEASVALTTFSKIPSTVSLEQSISFLLPVLSCMTIFVGHLAKSSLVCVTILLNTKSTFSLWNLKVGSLCLQNFLNPIADPKTLFLMRYTSNLVYFGLNLYAVSGLPEMLLSLVICFKILDLGKFLNMAALPFAFCDIFLLYVSNKAY